MAREARRLAIALATLAPAVLLVATPQGRSIAAGDFLQLYSVFLPACTITGLTVLARTVSVGGARSETARLLQGVAGGAAAFEGARVPATLWLLLGRGLIPGPRLLTASAVALVAVLGGLLAVWEASPGGPGDRSRWTPRLAALGLVAAALLPWFLLTGEGIAVVLFNDVTEPRFSEFPVDATSAALLWTIVAGLGGLLVGSLTPTSTRAGPIPVGGAFLALGTLALIGGYAVLLWQGAQLSARFDGGTFWPGVNVAPVLLGGVAAWTRRSAGSDRPEGEVAFAVEARDPP